VLSVALLLPALGSVTPPPTAAVAVLDNVPVAAASMVALAVKVTEPPAGRFTVSAMLPEPTAVQVAPPAPLHVQVTPVNVAGKVSAPHHLF
jgi:hypothetical protein